MTANRTIRAWKDEEYRLSLSEAERALLPANPAGIVELTEDDLGAAAGGNLTILGCTKYCSANCSVTCTNKPSCWPTTRKYPC